MPRCATLALADNRFANNGWEVQHADRMLAIEKIEPAELLWAVREGLKPVHHGWLAHRLEALWNSHSHAGSLKAGDWLKETARLLLDIPQDILQFSIDEAVKRSDRGFMPNVGQIRAIADPMFTERQTHHDRLIRVVNFRDASRTLPSKREESAAPTWKPKPGETAAILAEYGLRSAAPEKSEPKRIPTVQEYMDTCGISRSEAEKIVAKQEREARALSIGKVLAA